MADNFTTNPGTGGQTFASDDIGGVQYPRTKIVVGADGVNDGDVSTSNPLPVVIQDMVPLTIGTTPLPPGAATEASLIEVRNYAAGTSLGVGREFDSAATSDTGNFSIVSFIKRAMQNWTSLLARIPALVGGRIPVSTDGLPGLLTTIPDNAVSAPPSRLVGQTIWNCSFSNSGASFLSPEMALMQSGTGVSYSQASGALAIVAGTSTNQEFLARSVDFWRGSMMLRASTALSQRIANNNFMVVLADLIGENLSCTINSATSITVTKTAHGFTAANVGQFIFVGGITGAAGVPGRYAIASVPTADTITFTVAGWPVSGSCNVDLFGHSHAKILYNGTTATTALFDTQRRGWASGDTSATINTTASPGHIAQLHLDGRNAILSDTLRASSTTPQVASRANRFEGLPDDNLDLYLFIWSYNGTVAPASSTTWTISFLSLEKFANIPVYIQGNRGMGSGMPMPVNVINTATVTLSANTPTLAAGTNLAADVGIQYRANATGAASTSHIVSAASTNAANIKASAGRVVGWSFVNTTASFQYVKLHNTAGAPTAGTGVVQTIAIPPNGVNNMPVGGGGIAFATGIGRTIVTGSADTDATATTAGAVVGDLFFA